MYYVNTDTAYKVSARGQFSKRWKFNSQIQFRRRAQIVYANVRVARGMQGVGEPWLIEVRKSSGGAVTIRRPVRNKFVRLTEGTELFASADKCIHELSPKLFNVAYVYVCIQCKRTCIRVWNSGWILISRKMNTGRLWMQKPKSKHFWMCGKKCYVVTYWYAKWTKMKPTHRNYSDM